MAAGSGCGSRRPPRRATAAVRCWMRRAASSASWPRKSPEREPQLRAADRDRLLKAPDKQVATFEVARVLRHPQAAAAARSWPSSRTAFPLPLAFPDFARSLRAIFLKYFRTQDAKLLAAEADSIFPRGQSAELLATLLPPSTPG